MMAQGVQAEVLSKTVELVASKESAPLETTVPRILLPKERTRRSLNQIYEFDREPLGQRWPVILVPGRAEEFQHNAWWKSFRTVSYQNSEFRKHFKLYVFLYDSDEELDMQANSLVIDMKRRFSDLPETQPVMLISYSLGGVISREAMKDDAILNQVDTMIAIAVPFHGSPIFDPDWFSEYLNPPNRSPIRRAWDRALYRYYMFSKSNLTRGLKWDNFDSSKPQFDQDEPLEDGHKVVGDQVLTRLQPYVEYPNADAIRDRTIAYVSYLTNGYTQGSQPMHPLKLPKYVLGNSLAFPKQIVASVLPFYGFTVHSVFTYMNTQMANLPTYTPEDPQGKNTHLYRYNDGTIPVSSMLFLPPRSKPYDEDIADLVKLATIRQARVFINLDHMHLGEYSIFKKKLIKPDIMSPEEGPFSPHGWLVYDLLERRKELAQQAETASEDITEDNAELNAVKQDVLMPLGMMDDACDDAAAESKPDIVPAFPCPYGIEPSADEGRHKEAEQTTATTAPVDEAQDVQACELKTEAQTLGLFDPLLEECLAD